MRNPICSIAEFYLTRLPRSSVAAYYRLRWTPYQRRLSTFLHFQLHLPPILTTNAFIASHILACHCRKRAHTTLLLPSQELLPTRFSRIHLLHRVLLRLGSHNDFEYLPWTLTVWSVALVVVTLCRPSRSLRSKIRARNMMRDFKWLQVLEKACDLDLRRQAQRTAR